ncbi:MAG: type II 3-dehydroquinate dehydratase [Chloroflexota bacterium]|nr:MAG: 3-dehydroquinate dehydratase [Chloroflexota bacterium]
MKRILILHGPNLNLTGEREPDVYGYTTLNDIDTRLAGLARERGVEVTCLQSNHEGQLIDMLHEARTWASGALLNAGALAHYSYALRDAVAAVAYPVIEVHLSLPAARETFRSISVVAPACRALVSGFGWRSYMLALWGLLDLLEDS